ncbi:thioredoxin-like protein [Radiomyces spectabilis]|uniref:thioredoxin-like protein n=1 Tax=Radiomyces spectabilis TaxID=64574 RepID=UPI002220FBC6|nr:thioredoxin-like protein [Radiomyces spectabilis]KAI8393325.1 thioredoxin-like protein [Radiomyces spectabilis]
MPSSVRLLAVILAILASLCSYAYAASTELNMDTFKSLATKGTWFIEHYSPYCPHCIQFAPMWKKLAAEYESLETTHDFHFAQVDCSVQGDLCHQNNVQFFPHLQLYVDGQFVETFPSAQRNWEGLTAFIAEKTVQDKTDPPSANAYTPNEAGVSVDLDRTAFDAAKSSGKPWFVKFYAPWCGFCKRLAPTWKLMADELKGQVDVGEVNCDDHRDICTENGVAGYPTLKLFKDGVVHDYTTADRSVLSLVTFARTYAGPVVQRVTSAELGERIKENAVSFVLLDRSNNQNALTLVESVAQRFMDSMNFYVVTEQQAATQFNLEDADKPTIVIAKDGTRTTYKSQELVNTPAAQESLAKWIESEKFPLVVTMRPSNAADILSGDHIVALAVIQADDQQHHQQFRKIATSYVKQGIKESGARLLFAQMDSKIWGQFIQERYAIASSDIPALLLVDATKNTYYKQDVEKRALSFDDASAFLRAVEDLSSGKLVGTSTLSLPGKMGQFFTHGYDYVRLHWIIIGLSVAVLGVLFYRLRRQKSANRGSGLPYHRPLSMTEHKD